MDDLVDQPVGYAVAAAITGAIIMGITGGVQTAGQNQKFVKKCPTGRGYSVLE